MSSALSRRGLLERAGLAAIASSGLYGFLDELVPSVANAAVAGARRRPEQHLPERVRLVTDNNVSVVVPPLHHRVVTTRLTVPRRAGALREAQRVLERQVRLLESEAGPGLDVTIAWGLPYFARYLPASPTVPAIPTTFRTTWRHRAPPAHASPLSSMRSGFPAIPHRRFSSTTTLRSSSAAIRSPLSRTAPRLCLRASPGSCG